MLKFSSLLRAWPIFVFKFKLWSTGTFSGGENLPGVFVSAFAESTSRFTLRRATLFLYNRRLKQLSFPFFALSYISFRSSRLISCFSVSARYLLRLKCFFFLPRVHHSQSYSYSRYIFSIQRKNAFYLNAIWNKADPKSLPHNQLPCNNV